MSRSINNFEITVDKTVLLEAVKNNRQEHIANYNAAMEVYEKECEDALVDRLHELQAGEAGDPSSYLSFSVDTPVTYAHVYDRLIAMLDMTEAISLTINGEQYRNWIEDEWDWSSRYYASTMSKL
jgi:hypothetical protein